MNEPQPRSVRGVLTQLLGQDITGSQDVLRRDTPSWDSMKHLQIILTIEDEFGVDLAGCQLGELDSLRGIQAAVAERTTTQSLQ